MSRARKRLFCERIIPKFLGMLTILTFSMLVPQIIAQISESEVRGAWLNLSSFNTAERRATTLQTITNANLNTIFVLAPPVGANNGWTDPEDFSLLVNEATNLGLSVHAWILNMWRSGSGDADFTDYTEQQLQKQWVLDLLNEYPNLDGVNFDFIRYRPRQPVDEAKMKGVTNTIRIAYDEVKKQSPRKFLTATSYSIEPFPTDFASEYIPPWFKSWVETHPANKYTSPAYPNGCYAPQHMKYQQNSEFWIMDGILDGVMPMQYTLSDDLWKEEVDTWKSFLSSDLSKVFMGLGWYDGVGFDAPGIAQKIKYGRSQGIKGFAIYQIGGEEVDDAELVSILTVDQEANDFDAPFENPASTFVPVQLTSFTAKVVDGYVLLKWTTQTESENLGFHIYRSNSKNGTFRQINDQLIAGAGNSETVHSYRFIDRFVEAGRTYYYKIADVDLEGNFCWHGAISVQIKINSEYVLNQNYPNPFNPSTSIRFSLKDDGHVTLEIFNVSGQVVRTLVDKKMASGKYCLTWDARDNSGNMVPTGTYVSVLQINGIKVARKMAFIK